MKVDVVSYYIIIGVIVILIMCYIGMRDKINYNKAPKKIWTYWDDPLRIPKTVKMCMNSWNKWNPTYTITLLTKSNYKGYTTIPNEIREHPNFHDNATRFADLVRIWTLAEHGGIWIDASILINSMLDDWLWPRYAEFSGFYIEGSTRDAQYPVIENWFFACNKDSQFVKKWRDEFSNIAMYPSVEAYVHARKQMGVNFTGLGNPIYLAMHVSAQKILQIDRYPLNNLILKKAEDGPFKYLVETKWNSEKALEYACNMTKPAIIKFRGDERKELEKKLEDELSLERCKWIA
jgi:hypothetical protein